MDGPEHRMNEIKPGLFLGDMWDGNDARAMRLKGITHVLNAGEDPDNRLMSGSFISNVPGITYMGLDLEDSPEAPIDMFFDGTQRFIDHALKRGEGVLVHCYAGVSRSPTIVASYLMRTFGVRPFHALGIIAARRPIVDPNPGFLTALHTDYVRYRSRHHVR